MSLRADCVCGRRLDVPRDLAGRWVECPDCHRQVHVPGLAESEPERPNANAESQNRKSRSSRSKAPADDVPVVEVILEGDDNVVDLEPVTRRPSQPRESKPQRRRQTPSAANLPVPPLTKGGSGGVATADRTMCPFCGAAVSRRQAGEMLHCSKCDSDFSDLPPKRRKKRKKSEEPTSKFRSVKEVISDNRESFPLWGKWAGIVGAGLFGFIVILQIFSRIGQNIQREALKEGIILGIQEKYREKRMTQPTIPTVQINNLQLEEANDDGLIPFTAERSHVIVTARAGSRIYGLVDVKAKRWVIAATRIETMDDREIELDGDVSNVTQTAHGIVMILVLIVFLATLLTLSKRFVLR